MIRFIEISDQIKCQADYDEPAATDFAFWDTIIDKFLIIGDEQVFDFLDHFIESFHYYEDYPIKRFIKLISDKSFTKQPKSYYLR